MAIFIATSNALFPGPHMGMLFGTYTKASFRNTFHNILNWNDEKEPTVRATLLLILGSLILPNLLCSFISIALSTGINKKFFQILISYPASWVLPVATFFTIGPTKLVCCSKSAQQNEYLGLSKCSSIANLILTVIIYVSLLIFLYVSLQSCTSLPNNQLFE